jgi:hypothetical protein
MVPVDDRQSVEQLIEAVEKTLLQVFGGPVHLDRQQLLPVSDRSKVLRCQVLKGPEGVPTSIIVKQVQGDQDHP